MLLLLLVVGAAAEDQPATVTSDTAEWCAGMAGVVTDHLRQTAHPPPQVVALAQEGQRMCRQGRIRPGIHRLRRAWIMLMQPPAEPPAEAAIQPPLPLPLGSLPAGTLTIDPTRITSSQHPDMAATPETGATPPPTDAVRASSAPHGRGSPAPAMPPAGTSPSRP